MVVVLQEAPLSYRRHETQKEWPHPEEVEAVPHQERPVFYMGLDRFGSFLEKEEEVGPQKEPRALYVFLFFLFSSFRTDFFHLMRESVVEEVEVEGLP